MANPTDIRKGRVLDYQGAPHLVLEMLHRTQGRQAGFVQVTMRNLNTGSSTTAKFRSTDSVIFMHTSTAKLEFSSSSLADIKEKFNATKDHLNREIEQRQELAEELNQTRRELETFRTRVSELEVQARVAASGSDMIAGFDIAPDDDMELEALRTANDSLEQEVSRWKSHCAKLTRALKQFQRNAGGSADAPPAQQQG